MLGVGLGGLPQAIRDAQPEFEYPYQPAHVVLLDVAAETGAVGALLYLAILVAPWLALARHRPRWTPDLAATSAALAAISVVGLFDYYTWSYPAGRIWAWVVLALWAAAYRRATAQAAATDRPSARPAPHRGGRRCLSCCSSPRSSSTSRSCCVLFGFGVNFLWLSAVAIRTRGRRPPTAVPAARRVAVGHRPAPDLQRALRCAPAHRRRRRVRLPARPARDPGPRRLDRRDGRRSSPEAVAQLARAARTRDPARAPRDRARASRRARSRTALALARGELLAIFDADFVPPPRLPARHGAGHCSPIRRVGVRPGALGPHEPRVLAAHAAPGARRSTATSPSSRPRAGRRASGSTSTARPASGVDGARGRGRLARRHADRGPRPLVSRPPRRLARRVRRRRRGAGRAPGQLQRVPPPAAAMGARLASSARSSTCPRSGARRSRWCAGCRRRST